LVRAHVFVPGSVSSTLRNAPLHTNWVSSRARSRRLSQSRAFRGLRDRSLVEHDIAMELVGFSTADRFGLDGRGINAVGLGHETISEFMVVHRELPDTGTSRRYPDREGRYGKE
jgi:hypothetical protein